MIKVLIADDQELIRQSLKIILSSRENLEVVDAVADGQEVIRSIRKNPPDVVLMDIRMAHMDGVQCTKIIKENYPQIKIIILTTFDDDEYVYNALKYGASGYLLKGVSMDELVNAIETVHSGRAMINPDIAAKVVRLFSEMARADYAIQVGSKGVEELNHTEWKIIREVEHGASNKEIAEKLNLSDGTVRNYLSSVLNKLGLRDPNTACNLGGADGSGQEGLRGIMRKLKGTVLVLICTLILGAAVGCKLMGSQTVTLEFGMFAGSNWDVANANSYAIIDRAIQKFEKITPECQDSLLQRNPKRKLFGMAFSADSKGRNAGCFYDSDRRFQ
jgi:DNA-binding NarL/FixJ family response regulator